MHRRCVVDPRRLIGVLDAIDNVGDVGHAHRSAVLVSDHEGAVVGGRSQLIIGVDRVRALRPVEAALGLVRVRGRNGG